MGLVYADIEWMISTFLAFISIFIFILFSQALVSESQWCWVLMVISILVLMWMFLLILRFVFVLFCVYILILLIMLQHSMPWSYVPLTLLRLDINGDTIVFVLPPKQPYAYILCPYLFPLNRCNAPLSGSLSPTSLNLSEQIYLHPGLNSCICKFHSFVFTNIHPKYGRKAQNQSWYWIGVDSVGVTTFPSIFRSRLVCPIFRAFPGNLRGLGLVEPLI